MYINIYRLTTNLHIFCKRSKMYIFLFRGRLTTYGSQTQLEHHMTRRVEHNFCNTPNTITIERKKLTD